MQHYIYLIPVLALIGACNPENSDSTGASAGSSSEGGSTDAMLTSSATDATADPSTTSDPSATSTNPTTTGAETSGEGATGGAVDPGDVDLCEAFCAKGPQCGLRPGGQECVDLCVNELATVESEFCSNAERALLKCSVEMTCREFVALGDEMDLGPCVDEFADKAMYCSGSGCTYEASGDPNGVMCQLAAICSGIPVVMACDGEMCTCTVDDNQIGECAADNACMDLEGLETKGATCCGFV